VFAVASAFLAGAAVVFLFVSVRGPARVVNPATVARAPVTGDVSREATTAAAEREPRADAEARTETPPRAPSAAAPAPAASGAVPAPTAGDGAVVASRPSASRGQRDWRFFFGIGDALTRMRDGAILGTVIRLEKWYGFPDGTKGPAYVLRSPDGEAVFDADELERGARIQ
jgi:hypothetical protein